MKRIYKVNIPWGENYDLEYWFSSQNKAQQFAKAFVKDCNKKFATIDHYEHPFSIIPIEIDKETIELPANRSIWNFKQGK